MVRTPARVVTTKAFRSIQIGGKQATKTQQALNLPAGSSAQNEEEAVAARSRARQEYRNAMQEKLHGSKDLGWEARG